ncbi:hypothetical protein QR680_007441 [Steinernema hermaphroditum]|uniref:maleylacetoacetate isomerase n=1 Tax=Steinernema hermaphroditum TaxID=289476 RepID=A0AA39M5Z6_9BILA|nr:hypothetical protein QR680_007441 [Steinernema hermaphroditum]
MNAVATLPLSSPHLLTSNAQWDAFPEVKTHQRAEDAKPTLYSFWRSSCSWRVRIVLELKELDYDYVAVNLIQGEHRNSDFLELNPQGFVPVFVDGDVVLSESLAIMEYLEENHPARTPLLPENVHERAKIRSLCHLIASNMQPLSTYRVMHLATGDTSKYAAWASHWIHRGFEALEKELQKCSGRYSFGNELTLLDAVLAPQVFRARLFKVDVDEYPTIAAIDGRLNELAAFRRSHPSRQPDTPEDAHEAVKRDILHDL